MTQCQGLNFDVLAWQGERSRVWQSSQRVCGVWTSPRPALRLFLWSESCWTHLQKWWRHSLCSFILHDIPWYPLVFSHKRRWPSPYLLRFIGLNECYMYHLDLFRRIPLLPCGHPGTIFEWWRIWVPCRNSVNWSSGSWKIRSDVPVADCIW